MYKYMLYRGGGGGVRGKEQTVYDLVCQLVTSLIMGSTTIQTDIIIVFFFF